MNNKDAAGEKKALRSAIAAARAARSYNPEFATAFNVHLAELCLVNGVKRVTCYLPFGNEPDVELFVDWALENGIEVLMPVVRTDGDLDWVVFDGSTKQGQMGFIEAAGPIVTAANIDIAIIPALAISKSGIRLGKGKGFYDKALPKLQPAPSVVGVIFEEELLDVIPGELHDYPVDAVVTPAGITKFSNRLK
jgi:5-formyltetrahydrofolate cyclo-ligase